MMRAKIRGAVLSALALFFLLGSSRAAFSRSVTDHAGREVELPPEIARIAVTSIWPLPSVCCLFAGAAEKLAGIHPASMSAARHSALAKAAPAILNAETRFIQGTDVNIEELLKLRPDVVFYAAGDDGQYEKFRAAGIPAVAFSNSRQDFDCLAAFESWVKLLGEVFQQPDEAAGIVEYGRGAHAEIQAVFAANPGAAKPKVLILFEYGDGTITTSGGGFWGQYWIEAGGGVNVARNLRGRPAINMEQIYEWDPDVIFITNFSPVLPEDILENKVEGHDWSVVRAVREKRVYKFPLGMYRWFPPASDTPLALKWLAQKTHPDLFAGLDIEKELRDYYRRFYGVDLSGDDVYKIFHPSREASRLR